MSPFRATYNTARGRPKRLGPPAQTIPADPQALDDLIHMARLIYSGRLADGRTLIGAGGVYAANVVSPLVATDDGIALDMNSPDFIVKVANTLKGVGATTTLSDTTPLDPVDGGDPGAGTQASRDDHQHPPQVVPVGSVLDPLDVAATASAGSEPAYSREDHVHKGIVAADIPAQLVYTQGTGITISEAREIAATEPDFNGWINAVPAPNVSIFVNDVPYLVAADVASFITNVEFQSGGSPLELQYRLTTPAGVGEWATVTGFSDVLSTYLSTNTTDTWDCGA